jgi:hypothetical protein
MQFGHVAHENVLRSIRLTGEHLIPAFADRAASAGVSAKVV